MKAAGGRLTAAARGRGVGPLALLAAALVAATIVAAGAGAIRLSPGQILVLLARPLGVDLPWDVAPGDAAVFWNLRVPRVVLALLVGGALGSAGAALQGLFRNPLADPTIVGVSSGASLAAAGAIVLGERLAFAGATQIWLVPVAAFLGALVACGVVLRLGRALGETSIAALLLAGLAVTALCEATRGMILFVADDAQLRAVTFWSLGSLGGASWSTLAVVAGPLALAILALRRLGGALDLVLLGEAEARHSGVRLERIKLAVVALTALGVGAAVAVCGVIGFVGLVAAHLMRLWIGPAHRALLLASSLAGALLLLGADTVARTIVAPAEVPIGILTGLAGAPVLIAFVLRAHRQGALA